MLFTTQLIYNNTTIKTLNLCSRKIQTKRRNNLFVAEEKSKNIAANQLSEKLLLRQKQLQEDLIIVKKRMKNQKFEKKRIFREENKVYLQTRNFDIKNEMKKLKHTAEDFFRVIRNIQNTVLRTEHFKLQNSQRI